MSNTISQMHVTTLTATNFTPPVGSVVNGSIAAAAGIAATKLEHPIRCTVAQESGTASTDQTLVVHSVYGATGTLIAFEVGCVTPPVGAAVVEVDLKVNGSSVLSAAVQLTSATAAYTPAAGTISSADLSDGDCIEIEIDETTGGGTQAEGVYANVVIHEDAAP
jgi:hypothetical protein